MIVSHLIGAPSDKSVRKECDICPDLLDTIDEAVEIRIIKSDYSKYIITKA